MDDLIEALNLVRPYMSDYGMKYPTGCDHDVLWLNVDADSIPADVIARLETLSFIPSEDYSDSLISFRFGSC